MSKYKYYKVVKNVCVYRTYWDEGFAYEDEFGRVQGKYRPRLTTYGHFFYYHNEKNLGTYKTLKGAKNKCKRYQRLESEGRQLTATCYEVTYTELSIEITDC
tara:strand:- start:770 stop:1075 length:306 start_codon:yes stop_codon:yes gene_type:complete